jgi:hypothetical protein
VKALRASAGCSVARWALPAAVSTSGLLRTGQGVVGRVRRLSDLTAPTETIYLASEDDILGVPLPALLSPACRPPPGTLDPTATAAELFVRHTAGSSLIVEQSGPKSA